MNLNIVIHGDVILLLNDILDIVKLITVLLQAQLEILVVSFNFIMAHINIIGLYALTVQTILRFQLHVIKNWFFLVKVPIDLLLKSPGFNNDILYVLINFLCRRTLDLGAFFIAFLNIQNDLLLLHHT